MAETVKPGMRISVEADETFYGTVLRIVNGEAEVEWDGGAVSHIDVLDCEPFLDLTKALGDPQ